MICRFLVLLACAASTGTARADLADDLKKIAESVRQAKAQWAQGTLPATADFGAEIGALTRIIEDAKLNPAGRTVARYYRGDAYLLVNAARANASRPADVDAARAALTDY